MIRAAALIATVALSACATGSGPERSFDDPAVQQVLVLPVPEYFATLAIASDIARNCARYRYDAELDSALNSLRNADDRGSRAALTQRAAITMETDVRQRSFMARHGLASLDGDLCPAADAEMLTASAISAMLVPV
ncbi:MULTISPECIES: hypothetical protein [unclassified Yoonia]|uniref:hypothetical protein n=1 Tax=unclassified Yoonia TaxID=2629118 RepID=UPI002AFE4DDE|nr:MULTISPECIES: hypothetical protein [unclassified Yoonia]